MTNLNQHSLNNLMVSGSGIHISAYIENMGILRDVKLQLRESIDTAMEILEPVISAHEIKRLMSPIEKLIVDDRTLRNLSSNFGIFRTLESFRIVSIPIDVEQICIVSNSFHVKPLLACMQHNPEFLIFSLEKNQVSIFAYNGKSLEFVDLCRFNCGGISDLDKNRFKDCFDWLNEWLKQNKVSADKKIFVASQEKIGPKCVSTLNSSKVFLLNRNVGSHIKNIADAAQNMAKEIDRLELERNLNDFNFAAAMEFTQNNIAEIARSAVKGEVSKLLIAKDVNIFGTVNRSSGKLSVNPFQLDHEDDDILDDLAQIVVASGGQVVTVPRDKIPGKRVAIAIRQFDRKIG